MELKNKVYFIACCFPPFGRGNAITNSCVANYLAEEFAVEVVCMQREEGGLIAYQEDRSLEEGLNPRLSVRRVVAANWYGLNIALGAAHVFTEVGSSALVVGHLLLAAVVWASLVAASAISRPATGSVA